MNTSKLDLTKLDSADPKIKYGFAKHLLLTAAENPDDLYPYFNHFARLLTSENNVIKWTGIRLMGLLAVADTEDKTVEITDNLLEFLHGGNLIQCNHAIFSLGLIAQHKSKMTALILNEILLINEDTFDTSKCKAIAMGKALETLYLFSEELINNEKLEIFVQEAKESEWNATRKKANRIERKIKKLRSENSISC